MSKELFVSSTTHETKVAIVEEDQLAEVYFERENEYTLAGSIYKGRVTRVLPGMQSAFVDIGLERDAFLYVTDFTEQQDEDSDEGGIDVMRGEGSAEGGQQRRREERHRPQPEAPAVPEESAAPKSAEEFAPQSEDGPAEISETMSADGAGEAEVSAPESERSSFAARQNNSREQRYGRGRRGRRGRGFPESKFDRGPRSQAGEAHSAAGAPAAPRSAAPPAGYQPMILPGESISKYRNLAPQVPMQVAEAADDAPQSQTASTRAEISGEATREAEENFQRDSFGGHRAPQEHVSSAAEDIVEEEHLSPQAAPAAGEAPRRPTEEIDVHAILQSHAQQESAARPHSPSFGGAGVVEEEEIDEEEHNPAEDGSSYEEDEYEDFEEEMLDRLDQMEDHKRGGQREPSPFPILEGGADAAEVSEEHGAEERNNGSEAEAEQTEEEELSAADEGNGAADDFADSANERDLGSEGDASGEEASASLRGPSGQQRRVAYDRNRGNRRGGRRGRAMRGGGGRKFHRAPLPQITDLLKEGQEILVQIAKEPIAKKGARITSHIALPGRYLVYMPTVNHNGVSRKISSEEERQRLKRIILSERESADSHHGGFIVRTAASSATEDDLRADIRFLLNLWSEIRQRAEASKPPTLIYHDLNLVERILRDQVSEGFSHLWVDTEQEYERVLRFINRFQPSLTKRVKLYTKEVPLFEQFNIQDEINKALKSKVWLKSGGYIVINQTEALVAIDVNTGKYVGKTGKLEDTIVKTNVDAIREIVRQIRLRDLGGIIVIDFIDMDERRNRQKVMQALEEALKGDRAPSKVLQFNDFGLVAITRKRVRQSLERTLGSPCTYCTGTGLIKSVATVCNEIYVEMRKMMHHLDRGDAIVRVNPEVGKALKANNARWLQDMEDLTGKTVIVKPDPTLHQEQFDIH